MSISQQQFDYLNAMGIKLWYPKAQNVDAKSENNYLTPDKLVLEDSLLFSDILDCLELSFAELNIYQQYIDCGLFNWQFTENNEITFANNTLVTPSIKQFQQQPQLKQALWKTIQQYIN